MSRRHQRQALVILVYASVTLFIIYTIYNDWYLKGSPSDSMHSISLNDNFLSSLAIQEWKRSKINSSVPTILLWTPFFGRYELYYYRIKPHTLTNCPLKCTFTTDKSALLSSDAILFHIRDIDSVPVPSVRHPDQVWIFFNKESPSNTFVDLKPYASIFNWTLTYRLDSDVYCPYGVTIRKGENSISPISDVPNQLHYQLHYSKSNDGLKTSNSGSYLTQAKITNLISKPKLAAWIVSNCVTHSNREVFVKELRQHIEVDVYGKCGRLSCPTEDSRDCYQHVARTYKFYLSFENSLCTDYVTEKYFDALVSDMVPVVYGRVNYSRISPPSSFIDARNFSSPKELANYLLHLSTHDEEYLQYFKWKEDYTVVRSADPAWCALCEKLTAHTISDSKTRKNYDNIGKWWNTQPTTLLPSSQSPKPVDHHQKNFAEDPACLDIPLFGSESLYDRFMKLFL